jgi:hypothetical protein
MSADEELSTAVLGLPGVFVREELATDVLGPSPDVFVLDELATAMLGSPEMFVYVSLRPDLLVKFSEEISCGIFTGMGT